VSVTAIWSTAKTDNCTKSEEGALPSGFIRGGGLRTFDRLEKRCVEDILTNTAIRRAGIDPSIRRARPRGPEFLRAQADGVLACGLSHVDLLPGGVSGVSAVR
jgi:hypothetical protein